MTTSGTISGVLTAGEFVKTACELLGIVAHDEDVDGSLMDTGIKHLNFMMKSWQADGCNLWRETNVLISWPANTQDGILSVNAFDIVDMRFYDAVGNYQRLMTRYARADYNSLPVKGAAGFPTIYTVQRERSDLRMWVWPVPTTDVSFYADMARVIEDVTDPSQTLDLPQEWTECAFYGLADRLANVSGVTDRVLPLAAKIQQNANRLYEAMRDFDRPASVYFRPMGYSNGRF